MSDQHNAVNFPLAMRAGRQAGARQAPRADERPGAGTPKQHYELTLTGPQIVRAVERLFAASDAIETVMKQLNTISSPCVCCGANRSESWTEHQMHRELDRMRQRIRSFARSLQYSIHPNEGANATTQSQTP